MNLKPITQLFKYGSMKAVALILLAICVTSCGQDNKSEFYLSPDGSDKNPGTYSAPFKTIARAQMEIKKLKKQSERPKGDITVHVRGGIYGLNSTIEFGPDDSGVDNFRVIYKAFEDEKPVISGGKVLQDWEQVEGTNIWKAPAPGIGGTRELYVNGQLATIAKGMGKEVKTKGWGKPDDPGIEKAKLLKTYNTYQGELPVYAGYQAGDAYQHMAKWKNKSDIEAVYLQSWTYVICPVDSITEENNGVFIKMRMPCFKDAQIKGGVQVGDPSYFQNALELLDEPGEWYFDRQAGEIYYMPRDGENMGNAEVVVPILEQLLSLEGTLQDPVKNITFEGLEFRYGTFVKPGTHGFAEIQATFTKDPEINDNMHSHFVKTSAGIELSGANGIVFRYCKFSRFGGAGINISHGSKNNLIQGCQITEIGGSGIQVGGFNLADAHPQDTLEIVSNNKIDNNVIYNIGTIYKGGIGVISGYTEGTQITNNEIFDIAYSGISVGWGWGYWDKGGRIETKAGKSPDYYNVFDKPTVSKNHLIGWNHVYNVMKRLTDGAGIYTLSWMENTKIIGNHIHDNPPDWTFNKDEKMRHKIHGWPGGIYLDEGSGAIEITGNLIYNVTKPYNYNDLSYMGVNWVEREKSNKVHNNYFSSMPESDELKYLLPDNVLDTGPGIAGFPSEIAENAGLSPEFRRIKE